MPGIATSARVTLPASAASGRASSQARFGPVESPMPRLSYRSTATPRRASPSAIWRGGAGQQQEGGGEGGEHEIQGNPGPFGPAPRSG